ncbi:MAG: hypothetical protein NT037_14885 [Hyphomicrobiales bacterium]|nr:hypothetical protein [Hyphomicrobiales bacterium]
MIAINGKTQCHVRAVDADGFVPGALVQGREGRRAAEKLGRKLIRKPSRTPRLMVTDKPGSDGAARTGMGMNVDVNGGAISGQWGGVKVCHWC